VVLAPYWEDRHPDHVAASRIVQEAVFLAGLARLDTGQEPHRPGEIVYYMAAWEFEPSFMVDISEHFAQKQAVLRCYAIQVYTPGRGTAEPGTLISSEHYWDLLAARAAHYGRLIGKAYGEPFRIRGLVEIPDLLAAFGGRTY
jgi:LmbE family N-acetylglucosaminyl deacetylase